MTKTRWATSWPTHLRNVLISSATDNADAQKIVPTLRNPSSSPIPSFSHFLKHAAYFLDCDVLKQFEIATKEPLNPIKQDEKKGELRIFKKGDIYFNYGCFPRTWEDPDFVHPDAGVGGDNDPLDVCEIGLRQISTGTVRPVKVLGILCMIDEGEADWKVVAIDREDPWAEKLNEIDDVEKMVPGCLDAIREWFRTYKVPDGKPENTFALGEKFMDRAYALGVVHEVVSVQSLCVYVQSPCVVVLISTFHFHLCLLMVSLIVPCSVSLTLSNSLPDASSMGQASQGQCGGRSVG